MVQESLLKAGTVTVFDYGIFNFAREEGSLAIQLLVGVRLKGYKNLLKRSDAFREKRIHQDILKNLKH